MLGCVCVPFLAAMASKGAVECETEEDLQELKCYICNKFGCFWWQSLWNHLKNEHMSEKCEWRGIFSYLLIAEPRLLFDVLG